jgi:hypothetical protein
MMKLDWLEGSYYHFIIKAQSLLMIRQSDSSNESTDTKTQKTVNGNCIRWLERQIGSAQTLERYIESLQHYRQTTEGLKSLKHVLRSEMSLEQEWLKDSTTPTTLSYLGLPASRPVTRIITYQEDIFPMTRLTLLSGLIILGFLYCFQHLITII